MWSTILLLALLGFLGLVIFSMLVRETPVKNIRHLGEDDARCAIDHPLFMDTFSVLTNTTFHKGNRVEILFNGDVFGPLWRDLEGARHTITFHVFWFRAGRVADRLAAILKERARAGVSVLFLYDAFGTAVEDGYLDGLRDAGVEVAAFRPPRWNTLYKIQQRMHARTVVIDGRIGFSGGFAIADEWEGDGRHRDQWRDTSVRVQGPLADQLQAAFASNWGEATGELLVGDRVFPLDEAHDGERPGDVEAGLMYDAPSLGSTNAERFFMLSISGARERLYITNAYFVPDHHFRRALVGAAQRGVDVRVLTPGYNNDKMSTFYAGRFGYEDLLEGGVRIWHYRPTMVHAKTLVSDGHWAAIGSVNFDNRSMVLNDEVAVVSRDQRLARALEQAFLADLEYADEVSLEEFRRRPFVDRARERFYRVFSAVL